MIEAILDRTLVASARRSEEVAQRLRSAVASSQDLLPFGDFIDHLVQESGVSRPEASDYLWELLDEGRISLTGDYRVEKR